MVIKSEQKIVGCVLLGVVTGVRAESASKKKQKMSLPKGFL